MVTTQGAGGRCLAHRPTQPSAPLTHLDRSSRRGPPSQPHPVPAPSPTVPSTSSQGSQGTEL